MNDDIDTGKELKDLCRDWADPTRIHVFLKVRCVLMHRTRFAWRVHIEWRAFRWASALCCVCAHSFPILIAQYAVFLKKEASASPLAIGVDFFPDSWNPKKHCGANFLIFQ